MKLVQELTFYSVGSGQQQKNNNSETVMSGGKGDTSLGRHDAETSNSGCVLCRAAEGFGVLSAKRVQIVQISTNCKIVQRYYLYAA